MSNNSAGRIVWVCLLGSVIGLAIACKGSRHPEGWFDACCGQCSEGHCTDCNATKGECTGDSKKAECMHHEGGLMCREHADS